MNSPENKPLPSEHSQTAPRTKKSVRRRLIILLLCVVGCSGVLTLLVQAVRDAREAARCEMCSYHLRMFGIGLKNFDVCNGGLPPAYLCDDKGKPIHSWCALFMPWAGHYNWQESYSLKEPWNGPHNSEIYPYPFPEYQCPSVDATSERMTVDYVAVVGPDTMWPGRDRVKLSDEAGANQDTILLIEMPDSDYRCLEPRFPTVDVFITKIKSPTGKGIRCIHSKGLAYLTVGGKVSWFPPDTDPETIRKLFKRDPSCEVIPAKVKMDVVEHWEDKHDSH